jgi:hypothetical protein
VEASASDPDAAEGGAGLKCVLSSALGMGGEGDAGTSPVPVQGDSARSVDLAARTNFSSVELIETSISTAYMRLRTLRGSKPDAFSADEWARVEGDFTSVVSQVTEAKNNIKTFENYLKTRQLELQVEKERVLRDTARLQADPEDPVSVWTTYLGGAIFAGGTALAYATRPAGMADSKVWLLSLVPSALLWIVGLSLLGLGLSGMRSHRDRRRLFFDTTLGPGTEGRT